MLLRSHMPTQTQQPQTPQANSQKQTSHPQSKKQPPNTNPSNFKYENGDEVQVYSKNKKVRYTHVSELI